jgi:GTP cyclohydrolase I
MLDMSDMEVKSRPIFYGENKTLIMQAVKQILSVLDDDPEREGLRETPERVYKYIRECFAGMEYSNEDIACMFNKCFEDSGYKDLVVETGITVFSHCEHHLALMYDLNVSVGYIPNGKVIGLSKIARIADMCAKRLQLQERLCRDIADVLSMVLDTDDVIVTIDGKHGCMTARGAKATNAVTKTACAHGFFMSKPELRAEFYSLIGGK